MLTPRPLVFLIAFLIFGACAMAQDKPKLGLVLSGGGAKGVAHVGTLKAMEEAGLRPDYIAGTSMGAVIGSLYALGYSADQIEEMVLNLDWNAVLSNEVPLNYIAFEEKEYYGRYLVSFPIIKGEVALASGLIKGQTLTEVLTKLMWPSFQYESFDDFPIPFRCVATDVLTGDPIVFKDGALPKAVRASMALPTAFTAVDLDTTLVVDGGVLDNFPVDVVLEMGADYVIGVNVSAPQTEVPESMLGILMFLATIPSEKKLQEEISQCDLYLQPDMQGYTTGSFGNAPEILQLGKDFAQEHKADFEAMAAKLGMAREPFSLKENKDLVRLAEINIGGNKLFSELLIREKLGLEVNDKVSQSDLEEGIRRVYGINGFEKVDYGIEMVNDSVWILNVKLQEKAAQHLYLSVHADNIFSAGVMVNFTARDLLGKDSRTILAGDISTNPRFRFDYYKYMSLSKKLAFNARYDYLSEQLPYYEEGQVEDVLINQVHRAALNVITTQSLRSSLSAGVFYTNTRSKSQFEVIAPELVERIAQHQVGIRLNWLRNNLNDRNFPTSGTESQVILDNILATTYRVDVKENIDSISGGTRDTLEEELNGIIDGIEPSYYFRLNLQYITFLSLGRNTQLVPRVSFGVTVNWIDAEDAVVDDYVGGGWQRVWRDNVPVLGLQYGEMSAPNYGLLGLQMQHVLFHNWFVRYGTNLLGTYGHVPVSDFSEEFDFGRLVEEGLTLGYGAKVSWRTRLGPISGGISWNSRDPYPRYYFSLGFSFNYSD